MMIRSVSAMVGAIAWIVLLPPESRHASAGVPHGELFPIVRGAAQPAAYSFSRQEERGGTAARFTAHNPRQEMRVELIDGVVRVLRARESGEEPLWSHAVTAWGRMGELQPVEPARVTADRARVELRRGTLVEWYVNEPRGLEQGFTILRPPDPATPEAAIEIEMRLAGEASSGIRATESGLQLRDERGRLQLSYGGLAAWDSSGRPLATSMQRTIRGVSLSVEPADAVFPITIDPLIAIQHQKLVPADGGTDEYFGRAVAVSGDTVVIGTPWDSNQHGGRAGAAYVYVRSGDSWTLQQKLMTAHPTASQGFGISVDISGDSIVVGALYEPTGTGRGSVHVFTRSGSTWTEQARLNGSSVGYEYHYGHSVAIDGDVVVVGAYGYDKPLGESGALFVYRRSGTTWTEEALLQLDLAAITAADNLGYSVGIDGDTIVAARPGHDGGPLAHVYIHNGLAWVEQAQLAPLAAVHVERVWVVSIHGDTLVAATSRAAYVFERHGVVWNEVAKLLPTDGSGDFKGVGSVSVTSDIIVIGEPRRDLGALASAGAAYVYQRIGSTWLGQTRFNALDAAQVDWFGYSVAHEGDWVFVGSSNDDGTFLNSGSAYVFRLCRAGWTDLGSSLPGTNGTPVMIGCGSLAAGSNLKLSLRGAKRLAPAGLVVGSSALNMPFRGGTLVPNHDILVLPVTVDGSRRIELEETLAVGLPAGTTLYAQVWVRDPGAVAGFSASNAISRTAP